jgi:hypothetical protein
MTPQQAVLFGSAAASASGGFRDSAFAGNRDLPVHRWVPWIAGFSARFVDDCLARYLPGDGETNRWVLDPFAGVGTTLVQACVRGFNVVGFEINPYAALASKAKLQAARIDRGAFRAQVAEFERFMERKCGSFDSQPRSKPPSGFSGRTQLFSPAVERKVLFALDYIHAIEAPDIRDLFRLALGSVMVNFSNYSYEPSLTRRCAVDRQPVRDAEVGAALSLKLKAMGNDVEWLQQQFGRLHHRQRAELHAESFVFAPARLGKSCVDLVVTSPPYLNNYHYPRNTRPQLHWLGFASGRGYRGAREDSSFGKFWQTVRAQEPVRLNFHLPSLEKTVGQIRDRNRERGPYGGPGWANYVVTYFNDTHRFCSVLAELLKPDATAVIVLGNSIIQGVEVKTDSLFGAIAELCGLGIEDAILLRKKRTGTSILQSSVRADKAARKTVLYESAIVLKKKPGRAQR